ARHGRAQRDRRAREDHAPAAQPRGEGAVLGPAGPHGGEHADDDERQEDEGDDPQRPHESQDHDRSLHAARTSAATPATAIHRTVSGRSVMTTSGSASSSTACWEAMSAMIASTAPGSSAL